MNLNLKPTAQELRELLARCDDLAGNHILWVRKNGEVEITRVPLNTFVHVFEQQHPEMQLRCEMFQGGNEYVGPEAAADNEWVSQLLDSLLEHWRTGNGKMGVLHVPQF